MVCQCYGWAGPQGWSWGYLWCLPKGKHSAAGGSFVLESLSDSEGGLWKTFKSNTSHTPDFTWFPTKSLRVHKYFLKQQYCRVSLYWHSSPNCFKQVTTAFSFHVSGGGSSVKKQFSLATVTKLSFHIFKLSNLWAVFSKKEKIGQQCIFNVHI